MILKIFFLRDSVKNRIFFASRFVMEFIFVHHDGDSIVMDNTSNYVDLF